MNGFLSLAPLLLGAFLAINWLVIIVVVVAGWLIGKFKESRIALGSVVLLLLITMPLSAVLLTRSFFRPALSGGEDGAPASLSEGIDSLLENSALGNSADDSGREPEDPAASADAAVPAADARKPEDYSDEELIALAEECFDDMLLMDVFNKNNALIPIDYDDEIRIEYQHPELGLFEWPYYRVKDYTTMEEVEAALDELWYSKFARKYRIEQEKYVVFNGAVYAYGGELGTPGMPLIVDGILSRTDDEVVFAGHWEGVDGQNHGNEEFSLVYEDGRWKYGYC